MREVTAEQPLLIQLLFLLEDIEVVEAAQLTLDNLAHNCILRHFL